MAASAKKRKSSRNYKSLAERLRPRNARRSAAACKSVADDVVNDDEQVENEPNATNVQQRLVTPVKGVKRMLSVLTSGEGKKTPTPRKRPSLEPCGTEDSRNEEETEALKTQVAVLKQQLAQSKSHSTQLEKLSKEICVLQATEQGHAAARAAMEIHLSWLQGKYRAQCEQGTTMQERELMALEDASAAWAVANQCRLEIAALRNSLLQADTVRRQLHERVMTMRGNMRVFCRLLPLKGEMQSQFKVVDGPSQSQLRVQVSAGLALDGSSAGQKVHDFKFDRVFRPEETQDEVFSEVKELVQSALDGFNVCIFAYGQTGSGKTYTMLGEEGQERGICPRAIEQLVGDASARVKVSCLEIYNDNLVDLMQQKKRAGVQNLHTIRHDGGRTTVDNLSIVPVSTPQQALELVGKAFSSRSTAKTVSNERSSRSHTVLSLYIESGKQTHSVIHLVDLAGSERFVSTESSKLLKEQSAINSSLTCLKAVLRALSHDDSHVRYRDSKLTYLLQNAWQARSCKTLMIVTASQQPACANESIQSLRFAQDVLCP